MKNTKIKHKIAVFLMGALAFFAGFLLLILAFWQSDTVKSKAKEYAVGYLKKNNLPISIESIGGLPPFYWIIKGIEIPVRDKKIIIDEVELRISFLALAKREIAFRKFHVKNVFFESIKEQKSSSLTALKEEKATPKTAADLTLPKPPLFSLSIRKFKIDNFHLAKETFNLTGSAFLEKKAMAFSLNTIVYSQSFKENICRFKAKGSEKTQKGYFALFLKKPGFYFISPKLKNHLTDETKIATFLQGDYQAIKTLIFEQRLPSSMHGAIKGNLALEKLPTELKGKIVLKPDFSSQLSDFSLKNDLFSANGKLDLNSAFEPSNLDFQLATKDLSLLDTLYGLPIKGKLKTIIKTENENADFTLTAENLIFNGYPMKNLEGKIKGRFADFVFTGNSSFYLLAIEDNIKFKTFFAYNLKNKTLDLEKSQMVASSFNLASNKLSISSNGLMEGTVELDFDNLKSIQKVFPQIAFKSSGSVSLDLTRSNQQQNVNIFGTLNDCHSTFFLVSKINIKAELQNLFQTATGTVKLDGTGLYYHDLALQKFNLTAYSMENNEWNFAISAAGDWNAPFSCSLIGLSQLKKGVTDLKILKGSGQMLEQNFYLKKPVGFIWQDKAHFTVADLDFQMTRAKLIADIKVNGKDNRIKLNAENFPLDFFSFNPAALKVDGLASCDFILEQTPFNINSDLKLKLQPSTIAAIKDEHPLKFSGDVDMKIENGLLLGNCDLKSGKNGLLALDISLPLKIGKTLFTFDLIQKKNTHAKLAYEGRVEDILDFFNLKHNRLEGNLFCQLNLSKNLINPKIEGFLKLEKGVFENYNTGSFFQDISADISFEKSKLIIEKLRAFDSNKRLSTATGRLSFNRLRNFPYEIKCHFDSTQLVKNSFIDITADGEVEVKGNSQKGLIKGQVEINSGVITIPETIPSVIPAIPITYIHEKKPLRPEPPKTKPYPFYLDLALNIPKNVFVEGHGVNAELKGQVYLTGSLNDIISSGKLKVIKGRYDFSGKSFELIDSSILFPGKKGAFPELSITGQTEQQGILINAYLKGPLNAPKVYFSSSPSLPLGSIISLILFGQEISGISALQALQVANTISSLSEGNNIVETAKKKLGIDRLTIISTSSEESEDPDQVAILVGKYITKNIMLAFARGFEYGTTNIIVEVDIFKGLMFQFETMQQEQQNKFTLKWKHNY